MLRSRIIEILGRKLTAYIAGVKDVRAFDRWISGTAPYGDVEARIRFAYQVARKRQTFSQQRALFWLELERPDRGRTSC